MTTPRRSPRLQRMEPNKDENDLKASSSSSSGEEFYDADVSSFMEDKKDGGNFNDQTANVELDLSKLTLNEGGKLSKTALVYDSFMMKHKIISMSSHPEDPDRIKRIFEELRSNGLVKRCNILKSRHATSEEICLLHDLAYLNLLEEMSTKDKSDIQNFERQFNSIYFCQDTYKCATMAAGSLLNVVDAVCSGKVENGVAVIRPPGHHAEPDYPYGFCFFNNAAIAALYAKRDFGLKRILILDWDIHHGNGTQNAFYETRDVLYISLHRYDNGYFFPVKSNSNYTDIGEGPGEGFNVNIPWNKKKMGDPEYIEAFKEIVMPIAKEYDPELVIVSAGFDAAEGDPLGGYKVTPCGYGHMTKMLTSLAKGRVILALEGGYNLTSISRSMAYCTRVLLGDDPEELSPQRPLYSEAKESIKNVITTLKPFWSCLENFDEQSVKSEENLNVLNSSTGDKFNEF